MVTLAAAYSKRRREDTIPLRPEMAERLAFPTAKAMGHPSNATQKLKRDGTLARGGVHPKVAQDLARHSDINLTISRYSHTELAERAKALACLPETAPTKDDQAESPPPQDSAHWQSSGFVLGRRWGQTSESR